MGALTVGCVADVGEPGDEDEVADVGEAEQAVGGYCLHQCIAEYRWCIKAGGGYEACRADRDFCIEGCPAYCEDPEDPDCL